MCFIFMYNLFYHLFTLALKSPNVKWLIVFTFLV